MRDVIKKLRFILTPRERTQACFLLIPMSISALLAVFGVVLIAPFISVVANPSLIQHSEKLSALYRFSHCSSTYQFLIFLGFMALVMLLLSNIVTSITNYMIAKYTSMSGHAIASRLFKYYISQPYVYFLHQNSSRLNKNIFSDVNAMVTGVLLPSMQLVSKIIVIAAITIMLLLVNFMLALSLVVIFGGIYGVIFFLLRKKFSSISYYLVESKRESCQIVDEVFSGIKEVKVLDNERYFFNKFFAHHLKYLKCYYLMTVISDLQKYILEAMVFGVILIVVISCIALEQETSHIIPTLALYVSAGYRLMPGMQIIFSSLASIKSRKGSLDVLYHDFKEMEENKMNLVNVQKQSNGFPLGQVFKNKIEFKNLSFVFPKTQKSVLKGLNLTIKAKSTVGFVGMTGSGKTTAIDLILGLLSPVEGEICIDDTVLNSSNVDDWLKYVGYVPQNIFLSDDTVINNIAFGVSEREIDYSLIEQSAKNANIHEFIISELENGYQTTIGERGVRLSGGQRQRLGIARALYRDPEVLILDEATSAIDGITESAIMSSLHRLSRQKTNIIVAHRLTTLKECDEIFVFEQGNVVAKGTYDFLIDHCDIFRQMSRNTTR